jgi:hypothetical protein
LLSAVVSDRTKTEHIEAEEEAEEAVAGSELRQLETAAV